MLRCDLIVEQWRHQTLISVYKIAFHIDIVWTAHFAIYVGNQNSPIPHWLSKSEQQIHPIKIFAEDNDENALMPPVISYRSVEENSSLPSIFIVKILTTLKLCPIKLIKSQRCHCFILSNFNFNFNYEGDFTALQSVCAQTPLQFPQSSSPIETFSDYCSEEVSTFR